VDLRGSPMVLERKASGEIYEKIQARFILDPIIEAIDTSMLQIRDEAGHFSG
jgi:hypothetical protein